MQLDKIKSLIDAMAASDLAEMEFKEDGWSLRLVRDAQAPATPSSSKVVATRTARIARADRTTPATTSDTVRCPLYGIVWLRPNPTAPDFVTAGAKVTAGQTLCIVEAMKVFHEVRADRDGTIGDILVQSGQEVEAGQDLVRFG